MNIQKNVEYVLDKVASAVGQFSRYAFPVASRDVSFEDDGHGGAYVKINGFDFELRIKNRNQGTPQLHFPFMSVSDIHLGTRQSRAKRTAHMQEHTCSDRLDLLGDIVDGEHLLEKDEWHFADGHKQVLAHFLRKASEGVEVNYIPGNHDVAVREQTTVYKGQEVELGTGRILHHGDTMLHHNLCGKTIAGVRIADHTFYADPRGRIFKHIHGDQFDDVLFGKNKGFWYHVGSVAYDALIEIDMGFQRIPRCEHISIAAVGKRATKTIINQFLGVRRELMKAVDADPAVQGMTYGHSHMAEISRTPNGKLLINDGCCTEHVQAAVHDRHGTWALLEWHKDRVIIKTENGQDRTVPWDVLGLPSFNHEPKFIRDQHTETADRLCRLMYGLWSPKERQRLRKEIARKRAAGECCTLPPIPLPRRHPRLKKTKTAQPVFSG